MYGNKRYLICKSKERRSRTCNTSFSSSWRFAALSCASYNSVSVSKLHKMKSKNVKKCRESWHISHLEHIWGTMKSCDLKFCLLPTLYRVHTGREISKSKCSYSNACMECSSETSSVLFMCLNISIKLRYQQSRGKELNAWTISAYAILPCFLRQATAMVYRKLKQWNGQIKK